MYVIFCFLKKQHTNTGKYNMNNADFLYCLFSSVAPATTTTAVTTASPQPLLHLYYSVLSTTSTHTASSEKYRSVLYIKTHTLKKHYH